ncbi:MAG: P1 family peptidase [Gemmatimonadota bacterium]
MKHGCITDVPGIRVGHAEVAGGGSGCTVILGPFRGAVEVTGMATGSRELDALSPQHLVPHADAVVLTGGSAFGLAAADGVMRWLEAKGRGFLVRDQRVPIVPAAVIFDLKRGVPRPDAALGAKACEAASDGPVAIGAVGAGAGASIGKIAGPEHAMRSGLGTASRKVGGITVGALTVVNAFGDVLDAWGGVLGGARGPQGVFLNTARELQDRLADGDLSAGMGAGESTTLSVVATDAPLSRVALQRLARMAATALPRRISPVNTPFDGDLTFALSTGEVAGNFPAPALVALGAAARDCLESAIEIAVTSVG